MESTAVVQEAEDAEREGSLGPEAGEKEKETEEASTAERAGSWVAPETLELEVLEEGVTEEAEKAREEMELAAGAAAALVTEAVAEAVMEGEKGEAGSVEEETAVEGRCMLFQSMVGTSRMYRTQSSRKNIRSTCCRAQTGRTPHTSRRVAQCKSLHHCLSQSDHRGSRCKFQTRSSWGANVCQSKGLDFHM